MRLSPLILASVLCASALAPAAELSPGSPAPPLSIKSWFKGEPIKELGAGIYVVEFWATWCGPCRQTIPHLTKLAKANPDVTVIGVSIWEDDENGVIQKFVDDMGDKMDYRVGWSGNREGMSATWMRPAAQNGIPSAFIVKDRVIQWIGHPMTMDQPLAQIKAGTFDLAAFKQEFDEKAAETRRSMAIQAEISEAIALRQAGKKAEAEARLSAVVEKYPSAADQAAETRFLWLGQDDPAAWAKEAERLAATRAENAILALTQFAMRQLQQGGNREQGKKAIELALKASGEKQLDPLLRGAYFYTQIGDKSRAIALYRKAIAAAPKEAQFDEMRKAIEQRIKDLEKN
jgi:thiol-disulfide isomerase/thioredoxin